jgi:hypothetical protein
LQVADSASFSVDFGDPASFETGEFAGGSSLAIEDGRYVIRATNAASASYLWGKSNWNATDPAYPLLKNVMVEVEVASRAGDSDNWFGVMCRVDEADAGYAFLISADGFWTIAQADGQRGLSLLEPWRESTAIRKRRAANTLQVYCVDNYLALYVNGEFVGDHTDNRANRLDRVGGVGVLAGGAEDNTVEVGFDRLAVKAASFAGRPNTATPTLPPTATDQPTATLTHTPAPVTLQPIAPPATGAPSGN